MYSTGLEPKKNAWWSFAVWQLMPSYQQNLRILNYEKVNLPKQAQSLSNGHSSHA
jgi:hypothetical protein